MAYTTSTDLSPVSGMDSEPAMPTTVTWRVTKWEATQDRRWKVSAVSDHPDGNWRTALSVARDWFRLLVDDVERGRLRIKVDPVLPGVGFPGRGVPPHRVPPPGEAAGRDPAIRMMVRPVTPDASSTSKRGRRSQMRRDYCRSTLRIQFVSLGEEQPVLPPLAKPRQ